jgi:hypothetical protein
MKLYIPFLFSTLLLSAACSKENKQRELQQESETKYTQEIINILNKNTSKVFTYTTKYTSNVKSYDTSYQLPPDAVGVVEHRQDEIKILPNNTIDEGELKFSTRFSNDSIVAYEGIVMLPVVSKKYGSHTYPNLLIRYNINTKTVSLSEDWESFGPNSINAHGNYSLTYTAK